MVFWVSEKCPQRVCLSPGLCKTRLIRKRLHEQRARVSRPRHGSCSGRTRRTSRPVGGVGGNSPAAVPPPGSGLTPCHPALRDREEARPRYPRPRYPHTWAALWGVVSTETPEERHSPPLSVIHSCAPVTLSPALFPALGCLPQVCPVRYAPPPGRWSVPTHETAAGEARCWGWAGVPVRCRV